ncbi:unnamed protein product [Gadus morhua 'NCC']
MAPRYVDVELENHDGRICLAKWEMCLLRFHIRCFVSFLPSQPCCFPSEPHGVDGHAPLPLSLAQTGSHRSPDCANHVLHLGRPSLKNRSMFQGPIGGWETLWCPITRDPLVPYHRTDRRLGDPLVPYHRTDRRLGDPLVPYHRTDRRLGDPLVPYHRTDRRLGDPLVPYHRTDRRLERPSGALSQDR